MLRIGDLMKQGDLKRVENVYDQAASNLVAGSTLEATIQQLIDMGGGTWDRDTVVRALRAAFNNPERAVEYLYSFQALRAMVQANPQILQPMLQELGKQNPHLVRMIQEHQSDFLRLINEPVEGGENVLGDLAAAMPQAVTVTPEEREAIERVRRDHRLGTIERCDMPHAFCNGKMLYCVERILWCSRRDHRLGTMILFSFHYISHFFPTLWYHDSFCFYEFDCKI